MHSRVLPILNALGCLILMGLVLGQWRKEHSLVNQRMKLEARLAACKEDAATEAARATALERDIAILKESVETVQKSAEQSAAALAANEIAAAGLEAENAAAREKVAVWEEAMAARDKRIHELNGELVATRKRLDEAIQKLTEVKAR